MKQSGLRAYSYNAVADTRTTMQSALNELSACTRSANGGLPKLVTSKASLNNNVWIIYQSIEDDWENKLRINSTIPQRARPYLDRSFCAAFSGTQKDKEKRFLKH